MPLRYFHRWYNSYPKCLNANEAGYRCMDGTGVRQKWVLNRTALDLFLARLDPDRDRAAQRYEEVRSKLMTFFRSNQCWDAENLVDETIDRVVRRLGEVAVHELMPFIRGVARRVASEAYRSHVRVVSIDESPGLRIDSTDSEDRASENKRHGCLEECLSLLTTQDRDLTLEFYKYKGAGKIEQKKDGRAYGDHPWNSQSPCVPRP